MAKTKLEKAIESRMETLNEVQREIVSAQFLEYKRNRARVRDIDDTLRKMDAMPVAGPGGGRVHMAQRMALTSERSQLLNTNNAIASNLFSQLKDEKE